jgi:hypothetical protein
MLNTKDVTGFMRRSQGRRHLWAVSIPGQTATLPAAATAGARARRRAGRHEADSDVVECGHCHRPQTPDARILICGSLYFAGDRSGRKRLIAGGASTLTRAATPTLRPCASPLAAMPFALSATAAAPSDKCAVPVLLDRCERIHDGGDHRISRKAPGHRHHHAGRRDGVPHLGLSQRRARRIMVMAQRTTETSWTLFFDTDAIAFPMGGHFLEQSYQEWNANGQVDDCGNPGFGFNGGNWAQDFCIDNVWIEESSIDPDTPLPAVPMDQAALRQRSAAQLTPPVTSKAK